MKRTLPLLFLMITAPLFAQPSNPPIVLVTAVPSGACTNGLPDRQVLSTGVFYTCQASTWGALPAVGTVTVGSTTISGGTTGGLLYNNAGVLGNSAADTITSTGAATFGAAGAASTPGISLTGLPFSGNGTTSTPQLYLNSGAVAPTTWNTNGTQLGMNSASGSTANFLDFHTNGGGGLFTVTATGALLAAGTANTLGSTTSLGAMLGVSGGVATSVASTGTGRIFSIAAGTINRTTDTGTIALSAANSIGIPTLIAGASTTYTATCTLCITGAPVASTNVTITNGYALDVVAGASFFGGAITTPGVISGGTKFTTSGCSVSSTTGGATAGKFTLGANTCSVIITMNGATGLTAPNGWSCSHNDETTAAGNATLFQSTSNATTATLSVPATAGTTDVIDFHCVAF